MLIYWGCGEHVGAGQPTVVDFARVAAGQMPPGMAAMASMAHVVSRTAQRAGLRRVAERARQPRRCPRQGSLAGAHKVAGQLFAADRFQPRRRAGLHAGARAARSGHAAVGRVAADVAGRRRRRPAMRWRCSAATRTATSSCGARRNRAGMAATGLSRASEVRRLVAAGAVLPPTHERNACFRPKSPRPRRPAW